MLWVKGFASEYNSAVMAGVFVTNAFFVLSAVELYRYKGPFSIHHELVPDSSSFVALCVGCVTAQVVAAGGQEGDFRDQDCAALLPHPSQHLHDRHVRKPHTLSLLSLVFVAHRTHTRPHDTTRHAQLLGERVCVLLPAWRAAPFGAEALGVRAHTRRHLPHPVPPAALVRRARWPD